jgi:hemolysin activation/secretion protein
MYNYIIFFFFFITLFLFPYRPCIAAAPDAFRSMPDRANEAYEQRLRTLEENQRRSLLAPPPEDKAPPVSPVTPDDEGMCITVNAFRIEGATLLSRQRLSAITAPHEGKCLTLPVINGILRDITNAYVEKGYITSRALLEPQDISQGILRIRVVEGKVESIEPDARSSMQPRQFLTIFPFVRGSVLNLRDIEQGLDQLNRLPSNRAAMRIEPGGAPGASRVLVSNIQERTWRPFAGFDNLGQDTSGRAQYTLGLEKDNFIGCNDQAALYVTSSSPKLFDEYEKEWKGSNATSVTGLFSIPFGYWLLSASASTFHYNMQIRGRTETYTSVGDTVAARVALDRVVWRGASGKLSLGGFYQYRDVNNYFEHERLLTSSYRLSTAGFSLSFVRRMAGGVVALSLEEGWGLPGMSGAAYGTTSDPLSPQDSFSKTSASLQWYYPFQALGQDFTWTLTGRGQFTDKTLYGSERLYLGSYYTVRGFMDTPVGGDQGVYVRNELAWNVPEKFLKNEKKIFSGVQLFAAYDIGSIITDNKDSYERGELRGVTVGLRTTGNLSFEAAWSHPVEAPDFVKKRDDVWYVNAKYTF